MDEQMNKEAIHIKEIRELAKKYSREEIEGCITSQIEEGANICHPGGRTEQVVNELAKAGFVRDIVDKGTPLGEAVRLLAERIRLMQRGYKGE